MKKTEEKRVYDKWTDVKGLEGICRVIGSAERFSLSFSFEDGEVKVGINGCHIVEGKNGTFISYPAWKDSKGLYHDYTFVAFKDIADVKSIIDMF